MNQRRILVIGSQCKGLGNLAFLPQAAEDLYEVMTDPELGGCVSAIEGKGLLIDPTVQETKAAIKQAYKRAAKEEATLFIAYIGHGESPKNSLDLYLMPQDAEIPPESDTALHLTNLIKEQHTNAPGIVDGLCVLVDACYSGKAGFAAAKDWVADLKGTLRFEMITAAADRPAAGGCFSKTLTRLVREGIEEEPSQHLLGMHLEPRIKKSCPHQEPQRPSWKLDETLWLSRNAARVREPWAQTAFAGEIQRLTLVFQTTPALSEIVERSEIERCLAVVGEAGAGKSALAAALAWPRVAGGIVPAKFVNAIALIDAATNAYNLATTLAEQLVRSVPGFREAQESFNRETQPKLGPLEKQIIGPLERLAPATNIRLVVDALDRFASGVSGSIIAALDELAKLPFMRVIITARPDTGLPAEALTYRLDRAPAEGVRRYLERRDIPATRLAEIENAAQGSWLVVRVLADWLGEHPDAEIRATGQDALWDVYEEMLSNPTGNEATRQILEILAAAGAGSLLPLPLLCKASEALNGPATPAGVRDHLVQLRGLAVRSSAGTEREQVGLFHQTLVDHIATRAPDGHHSAHRALLTGIESLVPVGSGPLNMDDPVERYTFEREAEHFWALGERDKATKSLGARKSPFPRYNAQRWQQWLPRFEDIWGGDPSIPVTIQNSLPRTVQLLLHSNQLTLQILEQWHGSHHPDTLRARRNIAWLTGLGGDYQEALRLLEALLPDMEGVLGRDHADTFKARHLIVWYTSWCKSPQEALRLLEALFRDRERVLGQHHEDTLNTRSMIAHTTGSGCRKRPEALKLFEALLLDKERVLGRDHRSTLKTRADVARYTSEKESLPVLNTLLGDRERVLGSNHPDTLDTKEDIAFWTFGYGDKEQALQLFEQLLLSQEQVLGLDAPKTLKTRKMIDRCKRWISLFGQR